MAISRVLPLRRASFRGSALLFGALMALFIVATAGPTSACSITWGQKCGGKACPKGETCQKVGDLCECTPKKTLLATPVIDHCERANATLASLLGSSDEDIQIQAAIGLLQSGCHYRAEAPRAPRVKIEPGCHDLATTQFEKCTGTCAETSPDAPDCFAGCVEGLGAVFTECPDATRNFVAGNRQGKARGPACYDCIRDCSDDYYQCNLDCRQAEPWDPACYDKCDPNCESKCTPPCPS